jgi:hypothetical protein
MDANTNGQHHEDAEPPETAVREVSGKGVQWDADMQECQKRGWWGRWNGRRWEMVSAKEPGAVEDLSRLAALRQGQKVESDEDWQKALDAKFVKDNLH